MTHIVFESVARRLADGTYSPAIARRPRHVPIASPVSPMRLRDIVAAGIMGGAIGFMLGGGLS